MAETSTETGRSWVREWKNNGTSFRKSIRMFGSTGREPNKIFGSILRSVAVPRSFSIVFGPSTVICVHGYVQTISAKASHAAGLLSEIQWWSLEASLVCSLKFSSTSCRTAPRARTAEAHAQALSWVLPR